jgi:hypothetical protein
LCSIEESEERERKKNWFSIKRRRSAGIKRSGEIVILDYLQNETNIKKREPVNAMAHERTQILAASLCLKLVLSLRSSVPRVFLLIVI